MAEQLQGQFEKFVDSPYSKKRPSPYLHKVPTWGEASYVVHIQTISYDSELRSLFWFSGLWAPHDFTWLQWRQVDEK
jgi:hypothetical protein